MGGRRATATTATGGTARGARNKTSVGAFARIALLLAAIAIAPVPADGGVHAVFPSVALPSGAASAVVVVGSDFFQTPKTSCRFGGVVTRGDVVDASTFVCYPPPRGEGAWTKNANRLNGFVDVEVSMNAADFTKSGATFAYVEPASIVSIAPRAGDAAGGSLLVATAAAKASGFTERSRCAFSFTNVGDDAVDFTKSGGGGEADAADVAAAADAWTLDAGARFVSSAILVCEAPRARGAGAARVAATTAEAAAYGDQAGRHGSAAWSARRAAPEALAATALAASSAGPGPGAPATTSFAAPETGGAFVTFFLGAGTDAVDVENTYTCRFGTVATRASAVDLPSAEDAGTLSPRRRATATCATPAGKPSRGVSVPAWVSAGLSDRAPSVTPWMRRESSVARVDDAFADGEYRSASDGGGTSSTFGVVAAVTPRRASTAGTPSAVAVTGSGFLSHHSRCVIDGVASAPAHVVSSALMLCELPASLGGARVATAAASASPRAMASARADGATVTYALEALAARMDVTLGSTRGGAAAVITATAALPDGDAAGVVAARFGATGPVATRFVSRFAAETVTPARRPGAVAARLDGGAGAAAASTAYTLVFRYHEAGSVVAAIPTLVPVTGNVRVELFGWGRSVLGGPVACSFSGAAPSREDGNLACLAPPGGVGFVAVGAAGAHAAGAGVTSVAYAPRPRVAGVAPRTNYARGGAVTTLSGADFFGERDDFGTNCEFGSSDGTRVFAPLTFVSSAVARCETPALVPETLALVEYAGGAGQSLRSASGMTVTVLATPRVLSITPSGGPLRGGDVIVVAGENFVGVEPAACRVGSVGPLDARDADVTGGIGGSTLECVAPAREIGVARVAVGARTGAGYTDDDVWYEYVASLPVEFAVPSTAESGGAGVRALAVFGATLRKDERMPCVVGARSAPGEVTRHGEMTCGGALAFSAASRNGKLDARDSTFGPGFKSSRPRLDALATRGAFDAFRGEGFFAVGAGGLRSAANGELAVVFHFRKPAEATSVRPAAGFAGGGTVVRVSGRHMTAETGCAFGAKTTYDGGVSLESSALARCESPAFPENFAVGDAVAVAPSDALAPPGADAPAFPFASRAEPFVLDVAPVSVQEPGGTILRVFGVFGEEHKKEGAAGGRGRDVSACAFGAVAPVAARRADFFGDSAALVCVSPALARGGVSVRVGDAFGEYGRVGRDVAVAATRKDDAFADAATREDADEEHRKKLDRPKATAAYPDVASPFGGARVVVSGAFLDTHATADENGLGGVFLRFGGEHVVRLAAVVSSALALAEAPPRGARDENAVSVAAFANAATFSETSFVFAFAPSPTLVSVSPKHVVSKHGGLVTVRGAFGERMSSSRGAGSPQCRFGSVGPTDARVVDAASAECFAPARAEGGAPVAVSARGDTMFSFHEDEDEARGSRTKKIVLEYVDEAEAASRDAREARGPEWLRVERAAPRGAAPAAAPRGGGARASVYGENLGSFIAFGDVVVPVASFVSSRLVLVETPPEFAFHDKRDAPFASFAAKNAFGESAGGDGFPTRVALRGFDGGLNLLADEAAESSASAAFSFAYFDASRSVSFSPRSATEEGGTELVLALEGTATDAADAVGASACRVGTVGPLVGAPKGFAATTCVSPASKPGARRVSAGVSGLGFGGFALKSSRDVSSWTSSRDLLSVVPAARIHALIPSAATRASGGWLDVAGAWLDRNACGDAEKAEQKNAREPLRTDREGPRNFVTTAFASRVACAPSSILDAGASGVFASVRVSGVAPASVTAARVGTTHEVVFARLAAPRVSRVAAGDAYAGVEGGAVATLSGEAFFGVGFGVAASPPLLCVFSSPGTGANGNGNPTASAPARVVSGALATCETPPLAALLGVGGGDAKIALAAEGDETRSGDDDRAARVAAAPTPWALAHAPPRGGASGGVAVTVTVGGAVEGVRGKFAENKRTSGEDDGSAATKLSCAFGAVAPVAARAAGASSRDVVCVSPAARHGALAPLRVFPGAAVTAPPSPRARARGETDATFRVDAEGRAFATMRAGDASALVAGWGLTPRDVCAYGAAALLSSAATSVSGLGRSDGALLVNPARSAHKASVQEQRKTFGIVECAAPRGAAGFAVVSATSSRSGFFFAGVAFQYAREDSPRVVLVAPAAALGGQGDVLHVSGANMHASGALEWRAYANENAHANAELYVRAENNAPLVVVSSAVAVLETPALAAPSSARATATPRGVAAGSAGAGSDERRDTSSMSFAVSVAVNREVAEVSPAAGSASGGTLVSLSPARDAPEGDARAEIDVLAAGGSACWFGAVGPVQGRRASDADSGSVACASPAGAPSSRAGVSTRLAFGGAPNAEQNTLLGELTRAGGEAGTFSGDARARASSTFRRASDPAVPAALLSAAVVAPAGGDASVWVPEWSEPYGGGTSASWLMRHDGETLGTTQTRVLRAFASSGFLVSATLAPGAGGFLALAASRSQTDGAPAVFAHVPRAAAPELQSVVGPTETLSTGGALVFLRGRDLRGGADLGVLASLEPVASAADAARGSLVWGVSSALAVFETPPMRAAGAATLRLALGRGCSSCPRGSSSSLALATRPLGETRGPVAEPKSWFASPAAGGAGTTVRVTVASPTPFLGGAGAGCRFGTVAVSASATTATSVECVAPALKPGVGVVETTFNGREYTDDGETRFKVAHPPSALIGAVPSAVPATAPDGVVFGVDVVGAGLDAFDRLRQTPRSDRLELFGFEDADDSAYDMSLANGEGYSNANKTQISGGVVAAYFSTGASPPGELSGVAFGFGFGFGFVAVAVDAAASMSSGSGALEHLVVSVFAPPRTDALDPPLGPGIGATTVYASGRDFLGGALFSSHAGDGGDFHVQDASGTFLALVGAADGSGAALAVPLARVVSSALAVFETPNLSSVAANADVVVVRVVAGVARVSASTAANPSFVPTSFAATSPRVVGGWAASSVGGSTVELSFMGLVSKTQARSGIQIPAWCRFGAVGPVAGRSVAESDIPRGVDAGTSSTRVTCVAPAKRENTDAEVRASENRRDWFAAVDQEADARLTRDGVSVISFVSAARPAFAFPPATSAAGGGVFGGDRGVVVALDVPGPSPERVAAAPLGCAYGGVAGAASRGEPARGSQTKPRVYAECFPASDPFMEGFFPLHFFLAAKTTTVSLVSDPASGSAQISFELVAPPRARAVAPTAAHAGGGATVFVSGADLRRDGGSGVVVCAMASGATAVPFAASFPVAVAVSSALAICETPIALPAGAHATRVALAGAEAFSSALGSSAATLVATPPPTIRDVSPVAVSEHGGARVTLAGQRLRAVSSDDTLAATYGTVAPVALAPSSASEATFAAPARKPSANVPVGARRSLSDTHARAPSNGFAFEVVTPFTPTRDGVVPSVVTLSETEGADARLTTPSRGGAVGGTLVFAALASPRFFATGPGGAAAAAPSFFATPRRGFAAVSALAPVAGFDGGPDSTPEIAKSTLAPFVYAANRNAAAQLEFRGAPSVASVTPRLAVASRARAGGGSVLDIHGSDFIRLETRVRFGSADSGDTNAVHVVSSAYVRAEVFGNHAPGARVPLAIASAPSVSSDFFPSGESASFGSFAVEARALPSVFRARPAFGSEEGGVAVALTGAGFRETGVFLKCRFGSVFVTASAFVDANRVECVAPARAPDVSSLSLDRRRAAQVAPVAVAVNGRDFSAAAVGSGAPGVSLYDRHHEEATPSKTHAHFGMEASFTYGAKLEIFSLEPTRGPASGGTDVFVRGAYFLGPFGDANAGDANALVPSSVSSSEGSLGVPSLLLSPEGERLDRFFFFGCKFDQTLVPASAGSVTASSALCRSPPHAAGFVAVEVRAGVAGNFTVFGTTFEFQAPPRAETLFPPVGAAGGGTLVSVAGANFVDSGGGDSFGAPVTGASASTPSDAFASSPLRCRFGGGAESAASFISSAVLRCETPAFAASAVDRALPVDVSLNGGKDFSSGTSRVAFEPLASPLVLSLEPRAGTAGGGTVVRVFGRGFTADAPVWCKFGTTGPIPAEYASEGAVRCKSPAKATASKIPVEVSRGNTVDLTTDAVLFSV